MAKNKEKIVEKEPVVVDENAIVSGDELSENDVIDVEAPEVIVENSDGDIKTDEPSMLAPKSEHKLKIEIAFTDKYTGADYKVNDEITVDEERFNELINDPRHLVSEVK